MSDTNGHTADEAELHFPVYVLSRPRSSSPGESPSFLVAPFPEIAIPIFLVRDMASWFLGQYDEPSYVPTEVKDNLALSQILTTVQQIGCTHVAVITGPDAISLYPIGQAIADLEV